MSSSNWCRCESHFHCSSLICLLSPSLWKPSLGRGAFSGKPNSQLFPKNCHSAGKGQEHLPHQREKRGWWDGCSGWLQPLLRSSEPHGGWWPGGLRAVPAPPPPMLLLLQAPPQPMAGTLLLHTAHPPPPKTQAADTCHAFDFLPMVFVFLLTRLQLILGISSYDGCHLWPS